MEELKSMEKAKTKEKFPAWAKLTLITLVAGLLLGCTYMLTKDLIAEQTAKAAEESRRSVFATASEFTELEAPTEAVDNCFEAKAQDGSLLGYVSTITTKGYGGEIEVTVGMDINGVVQGVSVGGPNFSETAGLGAKAKDEAFTSQFGGLSLPIALTKDDGEVDAITGATITSRAVTSAVTSAVEYMQSINK